MVLLTDRPLAGPPEAQPDDVSVPGAVLLSPDAIQQRAGTRADGPEAEPARAQRRSRRAGAPGGRLQGVWSALKICWIALGLIAGLAGIVYAATYMTVPSKLSQIGPHHLQRLIPAAGLVAMVAVVLAWWGIRRLLRGKQAEDVLTVVAASIGTFVSATGMWRFFEVVLDYNVDLRITASSFLEVATLTSAIRARRHMIKHGTTGVDGILMWVFTSTSGVLAAIASPSLGEAVFRLAAPLVAAALWERLLLAERLRRGMAKRYQLTFTLERILVWLHLAEPAGRDITEVVASRLASQLALTSAILADLQDSSARGPVRWILMARASRRQTVALRRAAPMLAADPGAQRQVARELALLRSGRQLVAVNLAGPWQELVREMRPPAASSRRRQAPTGDGDSSDQNASSAADDLVFEPLAAELATLVPLSTGAAGGHAVSRIHELLATRADLDAFLRWLGEHGGSKRTLALVGVYLTGELKQRAPVMDAVATLVPGPAGAIDKNEIRVMAGVLQPVWLEHGYRNEPAAAVAGATA